MTSVENWKCGHRHTNSVCYTRSMGLFGLWNKLHLLITLWLCEAWTGITGIQSGLSCTSLPWHQSSAMGFLPFTSWLFSHHRVQHCSHFSSKNVSESPLTFWRTSQMGLLSFSLTLHQRNAAWQGQKTCVAVATGIKACSFYFMNMNSHSCAAVTGLPE